MCRPFLRGRSKQPSIPQIRLPLEVWFCGVGHPGVSAIRRNVPGARCPVHWNARFAVIMYRICRGTVCPATLWKSSTVIPLDGNERESDACASVWSVHRSEE